MRLGTVRDGTRDGRLVVIRRDGAACADARSVAPTLQAALDDWPRAEPLLRRLAQDLDAGRAPAEPADPWRFHAPLPRAFEWIDGSAYLNHVRLVRKSRGAAPPPGLETDPLVYQGGSGVLLGPTEDVPLPDESWGLDFEGEVCAILGDVPEGTSAGAASRYVWLLCLANDLTYRNLVPGELEKGFGFFQSKPATAFSPFAATPDEAGPAWREGRLHLRLRVAWNGELMGDCDAGPEMHFSFHDLVRHLCRTRAFTAGTILGSGTLSNEDPARGVSCLQEKRVREILASPDKKPRTRFLRAGDTVEMDMADLEGRSLFGRIAQRVVAP
ncbi:MAG TPA: fumarylacetoacetate hydrolase family protein [Anaeromyxobacteraceae bacterium]|nr:fumarylacetoacetate hydrolase family protein [Anaeromyxobacteraceae bacterium]